MKHINLRYILYTLSASTLLLVIFNVNAQPPLFIATDSFVLVASEGITLERDVQVSSGDVAANEEIAIGENNIISGNLFTDEIDIEENTTINGNVSFNELDIEENSIILGTQTTPTSLPIVQLPAIPPFTPGTQNLTIIQDQTISPGTFNEIEVNPNITLILTPGIYTLNELQLNQGAQLLFTGLTVMNIQEELEIEENTLIAPTNQATSIDLQINVQEDKTITIGDGSFISAKLLAPDATVTLGRRTTFRGQILAEEIRVRRDSILSREDFFVKESDPEKVVIDTDGSEFLVNEIMVNFNELATLSDAQEIAAFVDGRVVGFIEVANAYQIEVTTNTIGELKGKIQAVRDLGNPLVEGVFRNYVLDPF